MRWIYISPHLDDAVLSAGGFIYEQTQAGIPVEIWTIVCGFPPPGELTPLAQIIQAQWGIESAEEAVKLRRKEDLEGAHIVGAKSVHFDVPDCIYRRGPAGEPLYMNIFTEPDEAESGLIDQIVEMIFLRLKSDDQVICQLGIGGHVDHILVRQAVERLKRPLWYTADIPYLFKQPGELSLLTDGMKETLHTITEAGLQAWVEAILAHKSQLSSLFESPEDMGDKIRFYYSEKRGFSLWSLNNPKIS